MAAKPKKKVARKQVAKKPPGRPTKYSPAVLAAICERLGKGEPLAKICRDEAMPAVRTVGDWANLDEGVSASIARAREEGFDAIALDCLEIADEKSMDTIVTEFGEKPNSEWIARSKLRIETRLKLLSKWDPKRYGDKVEMEKIHVELEVVIGGSGNGDS